MNINEIKTKYIENLKLINAYSHALKVFHFDHSTIAPKKSMAERNDTLSILSNIIFQKQMDSEHIELLKTLYNNRNELDEYTKRLVEINYNNYIKSQFITPELQYKYSLATSNGYTAWLEAKEKQDYNLFKEALGEIIKLQQEMIALRPTQLNSPYDSLLDDYEKDHNTLVLDKFFNELKAGIIPLLKQIMSSNKRIREDFLTNKVKISKQESFSLYLLKLIGFDLDAGLLSTTEHPFTSKISTHDVRVTTHYYENLFVSNIFSTIHEGGHAIFGQNEPLEVVNHLVDDNMSAAMHECISRMYENMVGRSKEFIHTIYPKFSKLFKSEFKDVTENELYEGINAVHPSLIRIESDELTYCLHIIIRYEIERDLINGTLSVENALTVHWIADGKVIHVGNTIDLDAYSDQIGSYVRAEAFGHGGVLYTQAFTLDYDNAPESENSFFFDFGNIITKLKSPSLSIFDTRTFKFDILFLKGII